MEYKKHASEIHYQIIREDGIIVATKYNLQEAINTAIKQSSLCSQLFFIRSVKIEYNDIDCYQLGKPKC